VEKEELVSFGNLVLEDNQVHLSYIRSWYQRNSNVQKLALESSPVGFHT